jgi:hypothetical protein
MQDGLTNKLFFISKVETLLKIIVQLRQNGVLESFYMMQRDLREKMSEFNLDLNFNFDLWRDLKDCADLFNYLKLSKDYEKRFKWVQKIVEKFPEVSQVFHETHHLFDEYKNLLKDFFNLEGENDDVPQNANDFLIPDHHGHYNQANPAAGERIFLNKS